MTLSLSHFHFEDKRIVLSVVSEAFKWEKSNLETLNDAFITAFTFSLHFLRSAAILIYSQGNYINAATMKMCLKALELH